MLGLMCVVIFLYFIFWSHVTPAYYLRRTDIIIQGHRPTDVVDATLLHHVCMSYSFHMCGDTLTRVGCQIHIGLSL